MPSGSVRGRGVSGPAGAERAAVPGRDTSVLKQDFLDILVCPKCKGKLEYDEGEQTLTCWECRLRYEIDDDIPIMLIDKAKPVPPDESP